MIRTAVIDLFIASGKSENHAKKLGDMAKLFATELQLDVKLSTRSGIIK